MELSNNQVDTLQELFNVGVGRAAASLNVMLESKVELAVPSIKTFQFKDISSELCEYVGQASFAVRQSFSGAVSGSVLLFMSTESAVRLVAYLTDEEVGSPELDSIKVSTLSEIGNIVINGVMGTLANMLELQFEYSMPGYAEGLAIELIKREGFSDEAGMLMVNTRFNVKERFVEGNFVFLMEMDSFESLMDRIDAVNESHK